MGEHLKEPSIFESLSHQVENNPRSC